MNLAPTFQLFRAIAFVAIAVFGANSALAQIQNQPVDVITATPLSSFSDRSGNWPTTEFQQDNMQAEVEGLSNTYNRVPGLQSRESGSPTLSIRGSAQADRVLKLFDGIPLNMADGVGGSDLFLPTEALGSIRLFKGPASVYFGPSAMAGAVDHRLRYFDRPALRVNLTDDTGVVGTRSAFVAVPYTTGSADSPNSQITAFFERRPGRFAYDSVSTNREGRRDDNFTDTSRITAASEVRAGNTLIRPRVIAVESKGATPGPANAPFVSTFDNAGLLASIEAIRPVGSDLVLGVRVSNTGLWGEFDKGTALATDSSAARTSAALDSRWTLNNDIVSRTFIDINFNSLSASYLNGPTLSESIFEVGEGLEIALTETLLLQPAIRYRSESGDFFNSLSLTQAFDEIRVWGLYGEGFRAASLSDRFANVSFFKGNPGLRPERSRNFEIGGRFEQGKRYHGFLEGFSLESSLFYTDYTDLVETAPFDAQATTKINSGSAKTYGAEIGATYGFSVWTLALSYSHLRARNEDANQPLRLAPEHQLVAAVTQQLGPAIIEAKATHWSSCFDREFPSNQLRELPAWTTFDLVVRTMGLNDWEIKTGVLNIFDVPRELTIGYPEPQRRFFVSALHYL